MFVFQCSNLEPKLLKDPLLSYASLIGEFKISTTSTLAFSLNIQVAIRVNELTTKLEETPKCLRRLRQSATRSKSACQLQLNFGITTYRGIDLLRRKYDTCFLKWYSESESRVHPYLPQASCS